MRLVLVRLSAIAADVAQSVVAAFGGGVGNPTQTHGSAELRNVKPQKKAGRRR